MEFSVLEDQIRECYGRVVYSHKTHEKMAEGCSDTLRHYKLAQIALSALTASTAVGAIASKSPLANLFTAGLSVISLWVTGYMRGIDPGGSAQRHRDAASNLWLIRESYLSLLTDLRMRTITDEVAVKRRDELQKRLGAVYKGAPQTNPDAYEKAQKGLKDNEELTFSDNELDHMLPKSLRKS